MGGGHGRRPVHGALAQASAGRPQGVVKTGGRASSEILGRYGEIHLSVEPLRFAGRFFFDEIGLGPDYDRAGLRYMGATPQPIISPKQNASRSRMVGGSRASGIVSHPSEP